MFWILYAFFWVIPRRLNFYANVSEHSVPSSGIYPPMKMEQTLCSETLAYKIQTMGNYPEESIQQSIICFQRYLLWTSVCHILLFFGTAAQFRLWLPHVCSSTPSILSWFHLANTLCELPTWSCVYADGVISHMPQSITWRTRVPPSVWHGWSCQHLVRHQE